MGNTGSTGGGGQGGGGKPTAVKKCYYELLSVERTATQEEIKKAYKRKALELHPDRNFGNADIATLLFAEVQAAYEVLSDPQERAWYDSHRDVILHGKDPSSANAAGSGSSPYTSTTTSAEVLSWFGLFPSKSEIDYSDSPNGFYAMLDSAFARLAREEAQACEEQGLEELYYPSFGGLKSGYEDHVKGFYAHWTKFKTYKDFAWCDLYRLSGAPERRIRRAMEKENQRLRDDAKRDFEDNVRQFVQFVRKRDPRYTPKTGPTEAERQAANLARSKEQAAKARAANAARQAEYKAADWTEVNHDEAYPIDEYIDGIRPDEECEALVYECPACKKKFKTEGQFVAHEKSKKHKQAVWQLKKRMEKENKELGLDNGEGQEVKDEEVEDSRVGNGEKEGKGRGKGGGSKVEEQEEEEEAVEEMEEEEKPKKAPLMPISDNKSRKRFEDEDNEDQDEGTDEDTNKTKLGKPSKNEAKEGKQDYEEDEGEEEEEEEEDEDSDYVHELKFHARVTGVVESFTQASFDDDEEDTKKSQQPKLKIGKAKVKREKRKAAAAAAVNGNGASVNEHRCVSCGNVFPSKTKMFNHLKEYPSHAAPPTQVKKGAAAGGGSSGKTSKVKNR